MLRLLAEHALRRSEAAGRTEEGHVSPTTRAGAEWCLSRLSRGERRHAGAWRVVSGSSDKTLRVWDASAGGEALADEPIINARLLLLSGSASVCRTMLGEVAAVEDGEVEAHGHAERPGVR